MVIGSNAGNGFTWSDFAQNGGAGFAAFLNKHMRNSASFSVLISRNRAVPQAFQAGEVLFGYVVDATRYFFSIIFSLAYVDVI